MKEASEQEKKDKRFSVIVSAIIHTGLIVLFIFLVAWRMPDPPPEEYGMELNIGVDDQGSGDIDNDLEATPEETQNETPPESQTDSEETQEEQVEETPVEEVVEETEPVTEPVEEVQEEVEEAAEPVENPTEEVVDPVETQEEESEVKVEEEEKKEEVEEVEEVEKKEEVKEPEPPKPKPKPTVDNRALLGSKKNDSESKEAAASSQGKTLDERGQLGKPTGKPKVDGKAENSGGFAQLSLEGWDWRFPPTEKDDSQKEGTITFRIIVDDRGEIVDVTRSSPTTITDNNVVNFYKKQVQKLTFARTSTAKVEGNSTGKITFIIKTN